MSVNQHDIQENTFCRWANDELKRRGIFVKSIKEDFADGLALINLCEIISGESLGKYNKHPRVLPQKLENLAIALKFIQSKGVKLVNVGPDDIHSGNMRIILGLLWTLILRYEIRHGRDGDDSGATDDLLKWVQNKIPEYNIDGFNGKNWGDGRALCALVESLRPGVCADHVSLNPEARLENCTKGIQIGESIGVDRLLLPEEMSHPKVDKLALMTYIAQYRHIPEDYSDASRIQARGPGLLEGIVRTPTTFSIIIPPHIVGNLAVAILDKNNRTINHTATSTTDSTSKVATQLVEYTPNIPGECTVSITLDAKHVPGSPFTAHVLKQESLGGEGKIRVFFSTTSASQKGREDNFNLQRLLEAKHVHLRPDFEPWIAVDVMNRDDREAVFRRAGTRHLPIVFIDDEYVGDYDRCAQLEESGDLDNMLNMCRLDGQLISEEEHERRMREVALTPRLPQNLKDQ
eukprot:c6314_g1_i1.p1 GENE.c6314_g1_i1~~c6314_g1_i1.p1  ORF type:complete len:480 (-),score=133.17 c6314_g1_i1:320-1705(-)